MFKNVASQKWRVFAFDTTDGSAKTGDAANISAKIAKDYAAAVATNDVAPTEIEDGYYDFDLTQAESNADVVSLLPESSTADIQVVPCPAVIYTRPNNFPSLGIEADGDLTKVNTLDGHTAQTADHTAGIAAIPTVMRGTDGANTQTPLTALEVNAQVDVALADYGGPTRAEATADKDEILARGGAGPWTTGGGGSAAAYGKIEGDWGRTSGNVYHFQFSLTLGGENGVATSGLSSPTLVGVYGNNGDTDLGVASSAISAGADGRFYGNFSLTTQPTDDTPANLVVSVVHGGNTYVGHIFGHEVS